MEGPAGEKVPSDNQVKTFERTATGLVREISAFRTLVLDLMFTSPVFMFVFAILGIGIFVGADMVVSTLLALLIGFTTAGMYALLSIAYPRSGGDYIFISRILSPPLGFMVNFVFTIVNISVIGTEAVWVSTMALGPMFSGLGAIMNSSSLASYASVFSQPVYIFIIGAVVMLVFTSVMFFGTGPTFKIKSVLFFVAVFSVIVYIAAIGLTSTSAMISNFNHLSSTSYQQYSGIVTSNGLPEKFEVVPTLFGTIYAVLALAGFTISSYTGGEISNPKRSQFVGMFGAPIIYALLMMAVLAVSYSKFGYSFLTGISYAALTGNKLYTLPIPLPWMNFIAAYALDSAPLMIVLTVGLLCTLFAYMLTAIFASTRSLFAWTFDGIFPMKLAKVNEKYHVPAYSLAVIILISLVFIYLTVYTSISAFFTYVVLASSFGLVVVAISAIVFPFRKKDAFNSAPRPVSSKIGGVPVISLIGVAGLITSLLVGYVAMLPAFIGVFTFEYVYFIIALFVIGIVIYFVSYGIRKRQGFPVDKLQKEIPPE
ncbi:MAG: APC family permease [Thermoplasmata archaeon YP2-bin.285]|uniref:APC family permease n=2 Tax=Candidatus Sysuiplasma superficiale TaxID=2823368 RepID=A0A8J8CEY7_9ARCH|nr:APC family permease [Candidatus Sysuiplasma superficiale]